jgi:hypothetical protein
MKTFLLAAATAIVVLGAPAFAGDQGMTAGSEARGEPINSSFKMSAKEPGRYTPGARAHAKAVTKKKKHSHVSTTGSASTKSGY